MKEDDNMNRIFVCYSVPLMKFLKEKGLDYDVTGTNTSSNKTFYGYVRDEQLNRLLDLWRLGKS